MPTSAITTSLRVLAVDDSQLDAELMLMALRRGGHRISAWQRVDTEQAFLEQLATAPDIILCDYNMPAFSAQQALQRVKERKLDVPVIIISGSIGEETAVELIKLGAEDYLLKDRLGRLGTAIEHALEQQKLRGEARRAEEALRESEFKYRCLFDHLLDAAYVCDAASLRIIDANMRGERLLALDRASILGLRLGHFLPGHVLARLRGLGSEEPDGAVKIDVVLKGPRDGRLPAQIHATAVEIHGHRLLLVLVRDRGEPG